MIDRAAEGLETHSAEVAADKIDVGLTEIRDQKQEDGLELPWEVLVHVLRGMEGTPATCRSTQEAC